MCSFPLATFNILVQRSHNVYCFGTCRSDKRKDRVEIGPEQLTAASAEAEISYKQLSK